MSHFMARCAAAGAPINPPALAWGIWFGLCRAAWAFLWFLYFLLLVGKKPIAKFVGEITVAEGVLTGWIPGYLLLNGFMK